jgi:hypothetical protein
MTSHKRALAAPPSVQSSESSPGVGNDDPGREKCPLDAPKPVNRNESSDKYSDVVAVLNGKWRIIRCRDGIRWILQSRDSITARVGIWRGRSYGRTKAALWRVCATHAGKIDPNAAAILAALPNWIEMPSLSAQPSITRGAVEQQA